MNLLKIKPFIEHLRGNEGETFIIDGTEFQLELSEENIAIPKSIKFRPLLFPKRPTEVPVRAE